MAKTVDERIREAKETGSTRLDLTRNQLTTLPPEIGELTSLRELFLNKNLLTRLPPEIGQLVELRELHLRKNRLEKLPTEVAQLTNLRVLSLSSNRLLELPSEVPRLTRLRKLFLDHNELKELPAEITLLTELKTLDLSANRFTNLPIEITRLSKLKELHLSCNEIVELRKEIEQLTEINRLDLLSNKLVELPVELQKLTQLKKFYLHDNEALGIPPEILGPEWNSGDEPAKPADVLGFYFKDRAPLLEAKVLVLGQGAVGKTSLVNRLAFDDFDPTEAKTEGIDIVRWKIPGKDNDQIRVNIWDFGGQEIMHATHQFFLTKRSLYVLVLDARKGENESNIFYWLRIIQTYGADSPVLVVTNKCEGPNHLDLDERRLRKDYPSIRGFFKTSCRDGVGIEELRAAIEVRIQDLKHVYNLVPDSFLATKGVLEEWQKDFLEIEDYEEICREQGVKNAKEQHRLLRFLHDLGSVLHFDDPDSLYRLGTKNILNPEWVTRGVYAILNYKPLAEKRGVLGVRDVDDILTAEEGYPEHTRLFILGMMHKFELCFEFADGSHRYLVPELLPKSELELGLDHEDALHFEYHYELLPEGVIPRFIVRMRPHLVDEESCWRRGVVLDLDGNQALVRSDLQAGRVFVSVFDAPVGRRRALTMIRSEFQAIHRTIPGLRGEEMVPLPKDPGRSVSYEHLLRMEAAGKTDYWPEGAGNEYSISGLLDGIETREERQRALATRGKEFLNGRSIVVRGDLVMGDKRTQQIQVATADLSKLAGDLALLRKKLMGQASEAEHFRELMGISEAEKAARDGDGSTAVETLKNAGKWAIDAATDVGTGVLTTLLTKIAGI